MYLTYDLAFTASTLSILRGMNQCVYQCDHEYKELKSY